MSSRRLAVLLTSILAFAALASLALASPALAEKEPNDTVLQAEGPVVAGTYTGELQTPNDEDWMFLYAAPQTQLKLAFTTQQTCKSVEILDANGRSLNLRLRSVYSGNPPEELSYTTPAAVTRLFVHVHDDCTFGGNAAGGWTVTLTSNLAFSTGPSLLGPVLPIPEPNETPAQAYGPVAGGQYYSTSFDTSNDQDWAYFYTAAGTRQFTVTIIDVSDCGGFQYALKKNGESVEGNLSTGRNQVSITQLTSASSDRYDLGMTSGCSSKLGSGSQWRVDPADALSPSLGTPPQPTPTATSRPRANYACRQARARTTRIAHNLVIAKRRMQSARSVRAYNRARRQVRTGRSKLRAARAYQNRVC